MPVEAGDRDRRMIRVRIRASMRAPSDHDQHDNSDRDVHGMESGCDDVKGEEQIDSGRLRSRNSEIETWQQMLAIFYAVFDALKAEKKRAEQRGGPKKNAAKRAFV